MLKLYFGDYIIIFRLNNIYPSPFRTGSAGLTGSDSIMFPGLYSYPSFEVVHYKQLARRKVVYPRLVRGNDWFTKAACSLAQPEHPHLHGTTHASEHNTANRSWSCSVKNLLVDHFLCTFAQVSLCDGSKRAVRWRAIRQF